MGQMGERLKLKLMVVDDEPDNLDLLYRTFRREFQVFKAANGFDALEQLDKAGEMAVIISDQRMPKMNGTEFLSRTVERFPDTIRIVLTGYTDVEDLVEAINSGKVFKYITKPWNPDQLKIAVMQAADTYRVLKQRTRVLQQALRRESLINRIMTAIRESLDYDSMLQTVADTLGQTFEAHCALLHPLIAADRQDNPPLETLVAATLKQDPFVYRAEPPENSADSSDPPEASDLAEEAAIATHLPPDLRHRAIHQRQVKSALETRQVQLTTLPASADAPDLSALSVPLIHQRECLAVTVLYQVGPTQWSDETLELMDSVGEQVALAIAQAQLYRQVQAQSDQIRAELEVARQIQSNLLRQSLPTVNGLRIQARCLPARQVGGDFFEAYAHPQGDIWLAVGDVSGKGVPAALFMVSAISVLRRELAQEQPPPPIQVMQNLNHSLSDDLVSSNCFITMVLVRYTPASGELVYANAGHIYPMVWGRDFADSAPEEEPIYLDVRGVPLGIVPVWRAPEGTLSLKPGSTLLVTSDGITEATVADDSPTGTTMLNQTGLWELLKQHPSQLDLDQLLGHIQASDRPQEDDQTILSLEVI
jgi:serine phosphatase RsbU (regulator of sigma subunit)/FixJ family two-component response regulator